MSKEIKRFSWSARCMIEQVLGAFVNFTTLEAQAEEHRVQLTENDIVRLEQLARIKAQHSTELATLRQEVEDLQEVLWPFALYATALKGREAMNTVHRIGHQAIAVSSFREAREILKLDETPEEEEPK